MKEIEKRNLMSLEKNQIDIIHEITSDLSDGHNNRNIMSVPIAKLSTLGAGVSSLIPALNTITQSTTMATEGLYRLANAGVGDALKAAANGNFWGSLKNCRWSIKICTVSKSSPYFYYLKNSCSQPCYSDDGCITLFH